MKTAGCLAVLALLLCGCVHVFSVTPQSPERDLNRINDRISAHRGEIAMQDGSRIRADSIAIAQGTTFFYNPLADNRASFINRQIKEIVVRDARRGRINGLKNGLIAGAIVGAGLGLIIGAMIPEPRYDNSDPPDSTDAWNHSRSDDHHNHNALNGLAIGGVTGLLLGGGFGLMIGSDYGCVYEIRFSFPLDRSPRK